MIPVVSASVFVVLGGFVSGIHPVAAVEPTVTVLNGSYTGVSIPSFKQEMFLGIPYAQQPLPPLRLRPPMSLNTSWTGSRSAASFGPPCIGYPTSGVSGAPDLEPSEACLSLNVVRPQGIEEGSDIPVVVWIYGGGFQAGGSADSLYNGTWIVQRSVDMGQPVVFASFNYRVTAFGFMWSTEIAAEGTGNFGLLDQYLALRWVRENIRTFGGDPDRVTIMGESAGGQSVSLQLLAFGKISTDLFRAAIAESGSPPGLQYHTIEEFRPQYDAAIEAAGCLGAADSLECLRSVSTERFVSATNVTTSFAWGPVVDGNFLKAGVTATIRAGNFTKVPLLTGANLDEGATFGPKGISDDASLANALASAYPHLTNDSISKIMEFYPNDPSIGCPFNTGDGILATGAQDKRAFSIWGDTNMHAGRRLLAQSIATAQDVYSYHFSQPPDGATVDVGVQHGQEVAFVFGNPSFLSTRAGDAALSTLMTSYWISFINTLDPNHTGIDGAPRWPNYKGNPKNLVFKRQGSFVEDDNYRAQGIAFLNTLEGQMQH